MAPDEIAPAADWSRFLRSTRPPLVPEITTLEARELVPLWETLEDLDGSPGEPPYWAFSWPGSQALARFLLDRPATVRGRRVLDVGSGNGLAGVAAALAGARRVVANDVDPRAARIVREHGASNGVTLDIETRDRLDDTPADVPFDVVLLGDLFYSRGLAARATRFARAMAAGGRDVWIGEPGRDYAMRDGIEVVATFAVPVTRELENADGIEARVVRVVAEACDRPGV